MKEYSLICDQCSKEFTYNRSSKKFCSKECKNLNRFGMKKYRNCQYCQEPFHNYNKRVKYCSRKCSGLASSKQKEYVCEQCGEKFLYNKPRKFCSQNCLFDRNRGKKTGPLKHKIKLKCNFCGISYEAKSKNSKFCTVTCRNKQKYQRIQQKEKPLYKAICKTCNNEYIKSGSRQLFCSKNCRKSFNKKEYIKACIICDKKFKARVDHANCCGEKECKKKKAMLLYNKRNNTGEYAQYRNCKRCEKEFKPKRTDQVYCTKQCCKKHEYENTSYLGICKYCNKEFPAKKKNPQFCSQKCINHYNKKDDVVLVCQRKNCNNEYIVAYKDRHKKRYCSTMCANGGEYNPVKREEVREKIRLATLKNIEKGIYPDISGENNPMWGKSHSDEFKKQMSERNLGENNPNWRGGYITCQQSIRSMPEYGKWMSDVYDRDGKQCQICKSTRGPFQVDHIVPFSYIVRENDLRNVLEARDCEDLWDISNGRILCIDCHKETDTYAGKATTWTPDLY